jgi:hypothetical protein
VSGRNRDRFRYLSLAPPLRLTEMPEDSSIHDSMACTSLAN